MSSKIIGQEIQGTIKRPNLKKTKMGIKNGEEIQIEAI